MPIAILNARAPVRSRGFTLLELLAVIVIIGIILSFAVLSVNTGGRSQALEQEARRLSALIGLAAQEAVMQSREFGLLLTDHGYTFLAFQDNAWQPLEDDPMLRPRELPPDMQLELLVDKLPTDLVTQDEGDDEKDKKDKKTGASPQVLILSSGEMTPFEIRLRTGREPNRYRLVGHVNGKLELAPLQDHAS